MSNNYFGKHIMKTRSEVLPGMEREKAGRKASGNECNESSDSDEEETHPEVRELEDTGGRNKVHLETVMEIN